MIALSLRDIRDALIVAALGWPVLNLIDRVLFGLAVAGVTP